MKAKTISTLLLLLWCAPLAAEKIYLEATQDNTLYESPSGRLSNGQGDHMFVGRTQRGEKRRAVIAFKDLGGIPDGATITSVKLHLFMSKQNTPPSLISLHRVTRDWGEGASHASGDEGQGANSTPNDASWAHRFFDLFAWTNLGGDFVEMPSEQLPVDTVGSYTFGSTAEMVNDVQLWADDDSENFGWILIGEEESSSARRFDTRNNNNPDVHPVLEVTFSTTGTSSDYSGPWFDPSLDGEGYLIFQTPAGWLIYFFGYSQDMQFLWLVSDLVTLGDLEWGEAFELQMLIGEPGSFDMPTPSTELKPYGTLSVTFDSCTAGIFVLDGLDGVKTSNVVKLIGVDGTDCDAEVEEP
jgi:hypothetical protein